MSEGEPTVMDFTASAESAKLREWGKAKGGADTTALASSPTQKAEKPNWNSSGTKNPKLRRGSPTKVYAAHPEKRKAGGRPSLRSQQSGWKDGLRDGAADPPALEEPQPEGVVSVEEQAEKESALMQKFKADHDRELHELQRCLHVQAEEISDLNVKATKLHAAEDIAKGMAKDCEKAHSKYAQMEKKWMLCRESLSEEQRKNTLLTVELEKQGKDMTAFHNKATLGKQIHDNDTEVHPSSVHSLTDAEDALRDKEHLSLTELEQAAVDARALVGELHEKGRHEEAEEAEQLAIQLEESVSGIKEEAFKAEEDENAALESNQAKTMMLLKDTEMKLQEREVELEQAEQDLKNALADLDAAQAELARAPSTKEMEGIQEENQKLRTECEELRVKVNTQTDAEMSHEELEGEEALKAKISQLQKDKDTDHQQLMMEMHQLETEAEQEKEELRQQLAKLKARNEEMEAELTEAFGPRDDED